MEESVKFILILLAETMSESVFCKYYFGFDADRPLREIVYKVENYVERTVQLYSDKTFQQHFRMNRIIAYELIGRLSTSDYIPSYRSGRTCISPEKGFLMTLWYLSNSETFRQIADRFGISYSSAHLSLRRTLKFILSLKAEFVHWPSENEKLNISRKFYEKKGISHVIGAIDGCHVKIDKPLQNSASYVNCKGFHSLLIQGVALPNRLFSDIFCGEVGSIHDARLLRKSQLYTKAVRDGYMGNNVLLGDSAYPSLNWLVTPFPDNGWLTAEQRHFNFKHSSTRVIVEHSFGLLKGRFRRVLVGFQNFDLHLVVECIMAACILHNICILHRDDTTIVLPNIADDLQSDSSYLTYTMSNGEERRNALHMELLTATNE